MWIIGAWNVEKNVDDNSFPHKRLVFHLDASNYRTNYNFTYILMLLKIGIRNNWNLIIFISARELKKNRDVEKKTFFFQ